MKKDRAVAFFPWRDNNGSSRTTVYVRAGGKTYSGGTIIKNMFCPDYVAGGMSPGELRRIAEYMEKKKKRGRGIVQKQGNP